MSLAEFQRAFADLVASPDSCIRARADQSVAFDGYELSARERDRLSIMVRDSGMSVNCTLYRVNRLTPVYSVLPITCRLLGSRLSEELEGFWKSSRDATLQYRWEAWRFGTWIADRIENGILPDGPVADAIRFELTSYDVQAAPRDPHTSGQPGNSRIRIITLRYDPHQLVDPPPDANELRPLASPVSVVFDATGDALQIYRLRSDAVS